jgi:hypothetical protein
MENIQDSQIERERARIMEFFYRIGDGTLHVFEPTQVNSGLWQVSYVPIYIYPYIATYE